jgi:hypothetical protein
VALGFVAVACRSGRSAEARDAGAVVACGASIDRYRAAAVTGAAPDTLRRIAIDIRRDCAQAVRDDGCRTALTAPYEDYDAAMGRVAKACRDAYCSRLRGPRLSLCDTSGEPAHDAATQVSTVALLAAVCAYEIDRPLAEIASLPNPPLFLEPPRMSRKPGADARSLVLTLACNPPRGCDAALFGPRCVAMGRWAIDAGALGDAIRDAGVSSVNLAASPDVPYPTIIEAIDVLRKNGAPDVSFGGPTCTDGR